MKKVPIETKGLREVAVACPCCGAAIWLTRTERGTFTNLDEHRCRAARS